MNDKSSSSSVIASGSHSNAHTPKSPARKSLSRPKSPFDSNKEPLLNQISNRDKSTQPKSPFRNELQRVPRYSK